MSYTFINPQYVESGQELDAAEFDEILGETLPEWAGELSEGYAWTAHLPARADFQAEAEKLADHMRRELEA